MDGKDLISQTQESSLTISGRKKWSVSFWMILQFLWLPHPNAVQYKRKCLKCRLRQVESLPLGEESINSTTPLTESSTYQTFLIRQQQNETCSVCDTLWWDFHRRTVKYNEIDIGAQPWCHCMSGVMSSVMLLILLSVNICYLGFVLTMAWADSGQILHLLNKFSFILVLSSYPFMACCSKLNDYIQGRIPCLLWSRTFNIRFIVTRAQYVDWKHAGLPGKKFLFLCIVWPGLLSLYRSYLLLIVGCQSTFNSNQAFKMFVCVFVFVMMVTWGLFIYLIYFIRLSFHRQFRHLLLYLNEFQGEIDLCRDTIHNVYAEFNCFRKCCNIHVMVMFPALILGIATTVTWQYMQSDDWSGNTENRNHEKQLQYLGWNVIAMGVSLILIATGGLDVNAVEANFNSNVLHLQSERYEKFWKEIIHQIVVVSKVSNSIRMSIIFSILGSYMALQFQDQDLKLVC
ncbi:uncharacterized protein [Apostichopus japonicus]|uniref:uncharacterized protein n=1 Tax=Stichopus japonicus TaxID=307972 RepID=UPI003AB2F4E1